MENIKDLPLMERPREKLLHLGPQSLNNAELFAILLNSGTHKISLMQICEDLVNMIENFPERLAAMSITDLRRINGIGEIKAIVLSAAIELAKRIAQVGPISLENDDQVAAFLAPYLPRQESAGYYLVLLNNRNELLATQEFPILENNTPSIKLLIQAALAAGAAEVILCRQSFQLETDYFNKEKAFIIQFDAAATMMNLNMRGLLELELPRIRKCIPSPDNLPE